MCELLLWACEPHHNIRRLFFCNTSGQSCKLRSTSSNKITAYREEPALAKTTTCVADFLGHRPGIHWPLLCEQTMSAIYIYSCLHLQRHVALKELHSSGSSVKSQHS